MKGKQIVAIDVGSSNVVIAVGSLTEDGIVDIMGIVSEPVSGILAGRIENNETVARAIAAAKSKIEQQLGVHITEAYAGISGDFVRCAQVVDHVYVQDEGITKREIEELDRRMQSVKLPDEHEIIISSEPLHYMIDGKEVDEPCGAYGNVLSATYNFILCEKKMRDRLSVCLKSQGITVKEFVPNATISHLGVATSDEVMDGAVVVNMGAHITDVTVLLKGKVRHIGSIPMGADAINDDIRSLSITKYVEDLKVMYGSAMSDRCDDDLIVFPQKYHIMVKSMLRRNLVIAIEARLVEIADWVRKEIKEAGCGSRLRPALLLTGGGARMRDIEELFKRELKYDDVRVVYPEYDITPESQMNHISTPAYATVVSLLLYGAKRGMCSIAVVPTSTTTTTTTTPRVAINTPVHQPVVEVREVKEVKATVPPMKADVEEPEEVKKSDDSGNEESNGGEIIDVGPDIEGRRGWFGRAMDKLVQKVNKSFSDEGEQEL